MLIEWRNFLKIYKIIRLILLFKINNFKFYLKYKKFEKKFVTIFFIKLIYLRILFLIQFWSRYCFKLYLDRRLVQLRLRYHLLKTLFLVISTEIFFNLKSIIVIFQLTLLEKKLLYSVICEFFCWYQWCFFRLISFTIFLISTPTYIILIYDEWDLFFTNINHEVGQNYFLINVNKKFID